MLGEINELDLSPSSERGMTPRIFEFLFARIKAVNNFITMYTFWPLYFYILFTDVLDAGRGKSER